MFGKARHARSWHVLRKSCSPSIMATFFRSFEMPLFIVLSAVVGIMLER
jgi:hypothetical protein